MTAYHGITLAVIAIVAVGTMMYTYFTKNKPQEYSSYRNSDVPFDPHDCMAGSEGVISSRNEDSSSSKRKRRKQDKCTICFVHIEGNQKITTLLCEHVFHGHCIEMWLSLNQGCPDCPNAV